MPTVDFKKILKSFIRHNSQMLLLFHWNKCHEVHSQRELLFPDLLISKTASDSNIAYSLYALRGFSSIYWLCSCNTTYASLAKTRWNGAGLWINSCGHNAGLLAFCGSSTSHRSTMPQPFLWRLSERVLTLQIKIYLTSCHLYTFLWYVLYALITLVRSPPYI